MGNRRPDLKHVLRPGGEWGLLHHRLPSTTSPTTLSTYSFDFTRRPCLNRTVKTTAPFLALLLLASCRSSHNNPAPPPQPLPAGKHLRLPPGVFETAGFTLQPGGSIIGAGMGRTIIRLTAPARLAIDGWSHGQGGSSIISDLTVDCGASPADTNFARCGIGGLRWSNSTIERVQVVGLGSFAGKGKSGSESFGIILSHSTNCAIRDCIVERNTGGYVSAFCIGGSSITGTNLTANFRFDPDWIRFMSDFAGVLQAFTLSGSSPPAGSQNLAYLNSHTSGASRAVYCDTGFLVNNLTLSNISGSLKSYPFVKATPILLHGEPAYSNVSTSNVSTH